MLRGEVRRVLAYASAVDMRKSFDGLLGCLTTSSSIGGGDKEWG